MTDPRCAAEIAACQNHPERDKYPDLSRRGVEDWTVEGAIIHEEQRKAAAREPATQPEGCNARETAILKAPFPWFGGKSRVAHVVWSRFGDCANYVEPFAGSLAVLLGRPTAPRVETVNDLDAHLANFWRAIVADPEAVAGYADWGLQHYKAACAGSACAAVIGAAFWARL